MPSDEQMKALEADIAAMEANTPEEVRAKVQKILDQIAEDYLIDLSTPEGRVRAAKSAYPNIAEHITSADLDDDGVFTIHVDVRVERPLQYVNITIIKGDSGGG
jgi:hypothetical protein